MERKGILIDPDTGDLQKQIRRDADGLVKQGFAVADNSYQCQAILLLSTKGEFKEYPTLGASMRDMVNDHNLSWWNHQITVQLEADGFNVRSIDLTDKTRPVIDAV